MSVVVRVPGMWTTVQDRGRWGLQHLGVQVAGPMDWWSHELANLAVGNASDAATLEVTIVGPELAFDADASIAVTGAVFDVRIGSELSRAPMVRRVPAGVTVAFGARHAGARAYVAVAGGFEVPPVLGSRATDSRGGIGGLGGRALRRGDRLEVGRHPTSRPPGGDLPSSPLPAGDEPCRLRVLPGPTLVGGGEATSVLTGRRFVVSTESDRMGYRFEGERLEAPGDGAMISMPTVMGAVQLPPSGQPILLMADRQTSGGYPIVGVVISADLPRAGQLSPGQAVVFAACTAAEARAALLECQEALTAWMEPHQ